MASSPVANMVSKFSTTTSSHSSNSSTLFDKLAHLEKFRDNEPRQRWLSITTFAMLITQTLASAGGLILSGLVFGDRFNIVGQCPSQSFVLFASILAIPYVGLHFRAARTNYSIIRSQPFQHPLHSWTIIVARLTFVAWTAAVIASSVAVARASGDKVHLELDLFFCVSAFVAMTFCLAVVEKAAEPFILPWVSPRTSLCRISSFGSVVDDSVSRRGSTGSAKREMSEKRLSDRPVPAGPRPISVPPVVAIQQVDLSLPEDDIFHPVSLSEGEEDYSMTEPELKLPEPTLPLMSERYTSRPHSSSQAPGWRKEWSIFAGEAGIRASGTSTVADMSAIADSTTSGSEQLSAPAPYSVWTPVKPSQPPPAARSHSRAKSRTLTINSSQPQLETVHEVITPTVDIFQFMGGYSRPEAPPAALSGETRSDAGARIKITRKPLRGPRAPKVTVEDVPDEALTAPQPGPDTPPPTPPKTPRIPGSFVEDYPTW